MANNHNNDDDDDDGSYFKMEPRRSTYEHPLDALMKAQEPPQVFYHKDNDLATAFSYGFRPEDAIPKRGPGVNADIERQFTTCRLLSDFTYTNWTESIMPLSDSNLAEGLSEAVVMIANVAANGTDSLKHDDLYLTMQFLSTLRDDNGKIPPNVLGFIEHVDYLTEDDGTELNPYRARFRLRQAQKSLPAKPTSRWKFKKKHAPAPAPASESAEAIVPSPQPSKGSAAASESAKESSTHDSSERRGGVYVPPGTPVPTPRRPPGFSRTASQPGRSRPPQ